MGELRLNAVRTDTKEQIDFIDLREPVNTDKLVRGRDTLKARITVKYGEGALTGLVEIQPDAALLPEPTDFTDLTTTMPESYLTLVEG